MKLNSGMRLVELSHKIEPGMPKFSDTAPDPKARPWLSHQEAAQSGRYQDCSCEISRVEFLTSLGTYLDSPYHFHPDMGDVSSLELERLVIPGLMVDVSRAGFDEAIGPGCLDGLDLRGKAVLFKTGFSRNWGGPDYFRHPYLSADTAALLIEKGALLAGIDVLIIDSTQDPTRPVHVNLLKNHILIVENLTGLDQLPKDGFIFSAAPLRYAGAASFPVRAYAIIP
jgi:arylformamidase